MAIQSVRRAMDLTVRIDEHGSGFSPRATVIAAMWLVAIARTVAGLGLTWRGRTYRQV